jgi:hypothetical protein
VDSEVKKENLQINDNDIVSLSESVKKTTVIKVGSDFISSDSENERISSLEEQTFKRRNEYNWEGADAKTIKRRKNPLKYEAKMPPRGDFSNIPMILPGMNRGFGGYSTGGVDVSGVNDTFGATGNALSERALNGSYGIIKFSDKYKDGPLVFVVGGVAIENDTWLPGVGNSKHKEGYVWENGFNNLNNFHVYNCKKSSDAANGWKECLTILNSKSIKISKKILVGFSAGAGNMYSVLKQEPASNWSVIHIAGPYMPGPDDANRHINMIKSLSEPARVFYIQQNGLDSDTEGATVSNKKKIGVLLPKSNIINSSSHIDSLKKSAEWIRNNIKLNGTTTISVGGKSVVVNVVTGSPILLNTAKNKGEKGTLQTATPFVPPTGTAKLVNIKDIGLSVPGKRHKEWFFKWLPGAKNLSEVRGKPIQYENGKLPSNVLLTVEGEKTGETYKMYYTAVSSYIAMKKAAAADGVIIRYSNCYRPLSLQIQYWFDNPDPDYVAKPIFRKGAPETRENIIAGGSNHGLGKAFDVSDYPGRFGLTIQQQMQAQIWIARNGDRFGWYWGDAPKEDWHFVYVG